MRSLVVLIVLWLGVATQSVAQPRYFRMAGFNTVNGIRDTHYVAQFWTKQDGIPDSIVAVWKNDDVRYVFSDWHPVSYHIPDGQFYLAVFPLAACSTKSRFPGDVRKYRKTLAGNTYLSWRANALFQDTLLLEIEQQYLEPDARVTMSVHEQFDYTSKGLARGYRRTEVIGTDTGSVQGYLLDRWYDKAGHVATSRRTVYGSNRSDYQDSQYYEYSGDTIVASEYMEIGAPGTRPKTGVRSTYKSWHSITPPLVIFTMGDGLQDLLYHTDVTNASHDLATGEFKDSVRLTHEYDVAGRVVKETAYTSDSTYSITESSYHPDGDLFEQYYESSFQPRTRTTYLEHSYGAQGLLMSALDSTYTFDYPFLSVRAHDVEVTLSSVGNELLLDRTHSHILVHNVAGIVVMEEWVNDHSLDLSLLPSGLYFISIDGGKPRKHLIP